MDARADLDRAIAALLRQDGCGVVGAGMDRTLHLAAATTAGWPALRRGLPQSVTDLWTAAPGGALLLRVGYALHPLLAPLTLRARP